MKFELVTQYRTSTYSTGAIKVDCKMMAVRDVVQWLNLSDTTCVTN